MNARIPYCVGPKRYLLAFEICNSISRTATASVSVTFEWLVSCFPYANKGHEIHAKRAWQKSCWDWKLPNPLHSCSHTKFKVLTKKRLSSDFRQSCATSSDKVAWNHLYEN